MNNFVQFEKILNLGKYDIHTGLGFWEKQKKKNKKKKTRVFPNQNWQPKKKNQCVFPNPNF